MKQGLSITSSTLDFIKNNVLSITDSTRTNKLSEILDSYANGKSEDIFIVKNSRNRDAQGAIVDIELLFELLELREAVFEAADRVVEKIAQERLETFAPNVGLSEALQQIGVERIDPDKIRRLSDELEI